MLQEKVQQQCLGISLDLDLKECSLDLIQCESHIQEYVEKVLKLLGAEAYGACVIVHHGMTSQDKGFSMFQLTHSFSLSAHFIDTLRVGFINVFSDHLFDEQAFAEFSKKFFEAKDYDLQKNLRL